MSRSFGRPGRRGTLGFALVLAAAVLAAGCGKARPAMAPKGKALATLRTVLEAWQQGEQPASLGQRKSAISVADPAWGGGARLTRFEIDEDQAQPVGYDLKFPVKLWLEGKREPQRVKFTVSTSPARVVVRDFGG